MKTHKHFASALLTVGMLLACTVPAAQASTDELNELAGIRTPGTNITTTTVTATTSDGTVETYDIVIDHDFYDIDYRPFTIRGISGTAITTLSDMSSTTIGDYKYIEDIVIPKTVTSIVSCMGDPEIVVIPKTVTMIADLFGGFSDTQWADEIRQRFLEALKDKDPAGVFRSNYHNYYYPYVLVLYEGTEAEWRAINKPNYVYADGTVSPNEAQILYDKGYVRFNCNYYDLVEGQAAEEAAAEAAKPKPATVSGFTDVTEDQYYAQPVAWAVEQGITTGVTDTTFQPNTTCTQAQILTFIWRAQGKPAVSTTAPYPNLTSANYYYDAVNWAYAKDMIDGSFNPNSPCSRALAMQYLYQLAGSPAVTGDGTFTDVLTSDRYHDAVYWAVQQGITNGTSDTAFSPSSTCTRGQIVTFLWRAWA